MRFLATMSNCAAGLAPAFVALVLLSVSTDIALADSSVSDVAAPEVSAACGSHDVVYQSDSSSDSEPACGTSSRTSAEVAEARAYVIETANPGYTMTRQGADLATERLHPEFVVRLANAIREARNAGLQSAGVFSAYRPPAFGIGGFSDKFNSLHTYGLAVDMSGIGSAGSRETQLWHEIAARNGVVCPYGPRHRAEWNHCQPTSIKMIVRASPLRATVTAAGPSDLEDMFEAGNRVIESMASAAYSLHATQMRTSEAGAKDRAPRSQAATKRAMKRHSRVAMSRGNKSARHARLGARAEATEKSSVEEGRRKSESDPG